MVDMHSLLMQVVQNSSHGWDYVLEGTVQFGFSLMEGYSPRSVTSTAPFGDLGSVERMVCDTGAKVVLKTYEVSMGVGRQFRMGGHLHTRVGQCLVW